MLHLCHTLLRLCYTDITLPLHVRYTYVALIMHLVAYLITYILHLFCTYVTFMLHLKLEQWIRAREHFLVILGFFFFTCQFDSFVVWNWYVLLCTDFSLLLPKSKRSESTSSEEIYCQAWIFQVDTVVFPACQEVKGITFQLSRLSHFLSLSPSLPPSRSPASDSWNKKGLLWLWNL